MDTFICIMKATYYLLGSVAFLKKLLTRNQ